jgi:hypothetical protein
LKHKHQKRGYGIIRRKGKIFGAHQIAYILAWGSVPKGEQVLHTCHNPDCVNPEHLFAGTDKDRVRLAAKAGRMHRPVGEINPAAKLTKDEVLQIRNSTDPLTKIAADFGIHMETARDIKNGRTWRHV